MMASEAVGSAPNLLRNLADVCFLIAAALWGYFSTELLADLNAPRAFTITILVLNLAVLAAMGISMRRKSAASAWRIADWVHPGLVRAAQVFSLVIPLAVLAVLMFPPLQRARHIQEIGLREVHFHPTAIAVVTILPAVGVVLRWTWELRSHE
jgi:hypothetical protein